MNRIAHLFKHNWISLLLVVSPTKKLTRIERRCEVCSKREISLHQFSDKIKREITKHFNEVREYYPYKKGDWLDIYTRAVLVVKLDEE